MDYGTVRKLIAVAVILLFIEYLIGVEINLFVAIPQQTAFSFFGYTGGVEVLAHMTTGIMIVIVALAILCLVSSSTTPFFPRYPFWRLRS